MAKASYTFYISCLVKRFHSGIICSHCKFCFLFTYFEFTVLNFCLHLHFWFTFCLVFSRSFCFEFYTFLSISDVLFIYFNFIVHDSAVYTLE